MSATNVADCPASSTAGSAVAATASAPVCAPASYSYAPMSTTEFWIRTRPARSTAPAIHAWLVPASMHGDPASSRGLPTLTIFGSFVVFPVPAAKGVVQLNVNTALVALPATGARLWYTIEFRIVPPAAPPPASIAVLPAIEQLCTVASQQPPPVPPDVLPANTQFTSVPLRAPPPLFMAVLPRNSPYRVVPP